MKLALIYILCLCAVGLGQDVNEEKESSIRILPVGNRPPYKEVLPPWQKPADENGCLTLESPPFSIPPTKVWLKSAEEKEGEIDLRLNKVSERVTFSGEKVELLIKEGTRRDGESKTWTTIEVPKRGDYLLVLAKSLHGEDSDWEEVRTFLLDDSSKDFPAGTVRFVNTTQEVIAARISKSGRMPRKEQDQGKAFAIKPDGIEMRTLPEKEPLVEFATKEKDGTWRMKRSHSLSPKEGERCNSIIYQGNGAKISVYPFKENILRKP